MRVSKILIYTDFLNFGWVFVVVLPSHGGRAGGVVLEKMGDIVVLGCQRWLSRRHLLLFCQR